MNKNRFTILPTLDYELFGNGSGDVLKNVVIPTSKILKICEQLDCRMTIFVDILEFIRVRDAQQAGKLPHLNYDAWKIVTEQLRNAYSMGHDIQLHLHPQWYAAEYKDGRWQLDVTVWRFPALIDKIGEAAARQLIFRLKSELESIIREVDPRYEVIAFRAGGYCIQPEAAALALLKDAGIRIDSSAYFDGFHNSDSIYYDFRSLPKHLPFWHIHENLDSVGAVAEDAMIELPILSFNSSKRMKLNSRRIATKLVQNKIKIFSSNINKDNSSNDAGSASGNQVLWDFCLQSAWQMLLWLYRGKQKFKNHESRYIPLIIIGHSKDFVFSSPFRLFLLVACRILKINFETYRDWYYFLEAQIEYKPTGKHKQNVVSENISITS
ncbi:MAG: hypothetical protein MUC94_12920 [bacterium]|nr:hypothetical protein [bacterium]